MSYCLVLLLFNVLLSCVSLFIVFFFFKQKTAYEMRISDWSSDVCSSDLARHPVHSARHRRPHATWRRVAHSGPERAGTSTACTASHHAGTGPAPSETRSGRASAANACAAATASATHADRKSTRLNSSH